MQKYANLLNTLAKIGAEHRRRQDIAVQQDTDIQPTLDALGRVCCDLYFDEVRLSQPQSPDEAAALALSVLTKRRAREAAVVACYHRDQFVRPLVVRERKDTLGSLIISQDT
jgi:hypothetical protein